MSAPATFTKARPVAQHCAALLDRGNRDPLRQSRLPEVAIATAARLGHAFSRLLGGTRVAVTASVPRTISTDGFVSDGDALSACFLLNVPEGDGHVFLRITGGALLMLTEQVFGGNGGDQHELPDALPLTASLLAAQLQTAIATALSNVLGLAERLELDEPGATSASAGIALAKHAFCHAFALIVAQPERPDCVIDLAVCPLAHAALFGSAKAIALGDGARSSAPAALAAAGVQFDLRAVIAELSLPLIDVARLRSGDTVPLAMARGVKLKAGDLAIADATVGAVDGKVALQLVRVF